MNSAANSTVVTVGQIWVCKLEGARAKKYSVVCILEKNEGSHGLEAPRRAVLMPVRGKGAYPTQVLINEQSEVVVSPKGFEVSAK